MSRALCSPSRNIGLHQWEGVSSLLPVPVPGREVARPRQQALGEETHHSRGERAIQLFKHVESVSLSKTLKQCFSLAGRVLSCCPYCTSVKFQAKSNGQICPIRRAAFSCTAFYSHHSLIAPREQSLNTGDDSWRFSSSKPVETSACGEMISSEKTTSQKTILSH